MGVPDGDGFDIITIFKDAVEAYILNEALALKLLDWFGIEKEEGRERRLKRRIIG